MCGIVGGVGTLAPAEVELEKLVSDLSRRGPDFVSMYNGTELLSLGSARLAMVDFDSGANQPIQLDHLMLLFNGEIYNWRELINFYELKFKSRTPQNDGEVIISGFVRFGDEFLSKLRGPFALVLVDKSDESDIIVHLARDMFGEKPLFYSLDDSGGIFFSSDARQVMSKSRNFSLSAPDVLVEFLRHGFIGQSHFERPNLFQVPAGVAIRISVNSLTRTIRNIPLDKFQILDNFDSSQNKLFHALELSVKESVTSSQFPLGIFLSSGVDSTLIAAIAASHGLDIPAFTVCYTEGQYSESKDAKEQSKTIGIRHHILKCHYSREALELCLKSMDLPISDMSLYPLYMLSQFAKTFVKGALTGDGGDELFGGYDTYAATNFNNTFGSLIHGIGAHNLANYISVNSHERSRLNDFVRILKYSSPDSRVAHTSWRTIFDQREILNLLGDIDLKTEDKIPSHSITLREAMKIDQSNWLPGNVLVKSDRASMNNGFELRAPLLSPIVLRASQQLSNEELRSMFRNKIILRNILKDRFNITLARKKGFIPPLSIWIRRDWVYFLSSILDCGKFDANFVAKLMGLHVSGKANNAHKLYTLYVYSIWIQSTQGRFYADCDYPKL